MAQIVRAEGLYGYIASTNTEEAKENEKTKEGRKKSGYWSLIVRDEAVILENKKQDGEVFFSFLFLFFFFLVGCVLPFILRDDCHRFHCLLGDDHEAKAEVD